MSRRRRGEVLRRGSGNSGGSTPENGSSAQLQGGWRGECARAADDAVRSAGEGGAAGGARSLESERRW